MRKPAFYHFYFEYKFKICVNKFIYIQLIWN